MMSGPARYLGRIAEVGAPPRGAATLYDGELFALTCRRTFLGDFPASSLTHSVTHSFTDSLTQSLRTCIIAALRDVRPLASLHPSNLPSLPDRRHLNRRQLDAARGVVIANVALNYLPSLPC